MSLGIAIGNGAAGDKRGFEMRSRVVDPHLVESHVTEVS